MNYAVLGLLVLVLLGGLVCFGVGHRRWSIASVVAAFLVLLAASTYLALATRLATHEWSWAQFVRGRQVRLARVRDAEAPDKDGLLAPVQDEKPIASLAEDRARWQSVLDRIDTWRERHWDKASFLPPQPGEGGKLQPGRIELPVEVVAEGRRPAEPAAAEPAGEPPAAAPAEPAAAAPAAEPAAEPAAGDAPAAAPERGPESPIDVGTTIFVFDDAPATDGGRYLGAFLVQAAAYDANSRRFVLTVDATAPPDDYDASAWQGKHDSVTVFEELPVDRWLGFTATPKTAPVDDAPSSRAPALVEPPLKSIEDVEAMLDARDRHGQFIEELKAHGERIDDRERWSGIREALKKGDSWPGQYWATVTVKEPFAFPLAVADEDAKRTFEIDEEAEFDLATAFELEDDGKATVKSVRRRRLLQDARTLLHGTLISAAAGEAGGDGAQAGGIAAAGIAALIDGLRHDIADLDAANKRLEDSHASLTSEIGTATDRRDQLADDMRSWTRDAQAAAGLVTRFEAEVEDARGGLKAAEAAIQRFGAELRDAVGRLVRQVDERAPAADRPPAAPR